MREYTKVTITRKGEKMARGGHPWVFGDEVLDVAGPVENGDLVDVVSEKKGKYIGTGFYNDHSKIRVRLLSRNANDRFDEAFFARRIQYALDYRKTVMPGEDFKDCRLIFGEADGFPGLTVDRFGDVLVAQVLSLGMEQRKELIFTQLLEQLRAMGEEVKGIYERNDVKIRELEGLTEGQGIAEIPGSTLTEPFSHRPALVVEKSVLLPVLPSCLKQNTAPENWSEGVRLIPYHAVSGPGFLPGFVPEELKVSGGEESLVLRDCWIAVCDRQLGDGRFQALIPPAIFD